MIQKFSHSKIEKYKMCPKAYMFVYIKKIPTKRKDYFDLGNFCHKVLEFFHKAFINKKEINIEEYKEIFKKHYEKTKECYNEDKKVVDYNEAKKMLHKYFWNFIKLEKKPKVLSTEKKIDFKIKDTLFTGVIDRVDEIDKNTYEVLDYKTTKSIDYLSPLQLPLYHIAMRQIYGKDKKYISSYVLLKHNSEKISKTFSIEELQEKGKETIEIVDQILNDTKWERKQSKLCDYCDFNKICS